jgi:hypothetical protein
MELLLKGLERVGDGAEVAAGGDFQFIKLPRHGLREVFKDIDIALFPPFLKVAGEGAGIAEGAGMLATDIGIKQETLGGAFPSSVRLKGMPPAVNLLSRVNDDNILFQGNQDKFNQFQKILQI